VIPTPPQHCEPTDQVALAADNFHFGSNKYHLDSNGNNVQYSFTADSVESTNNGWTEAVQTNYEFTLQNGEIDATFNTVTTTDNNGETTVTGCNGWWDGENVDLTDNECEQAQWFLNHCYIVDPISNKRFTANSVNFDTLRGQALMYGDWFCMSGANEWQFNFESCQWDQLQGVQGLLEVRSASEGLKKNTQRILA